MYHEDPSSTQKREQTGTAPTDQIERCLDLLLSASSAQHQQGGELLRTLCGLRVASRLALAAMGLEQGSWLRCHAVAGVLRAGGFLDEAKRADRHGGKGLGRDERKRILATLQGAGCPLQEVYSLGFWGRAYRDLTDEGRHQWKGALAWMAHRLIEQGEGDPWRDPLADPWPGDAFYSTGQRSDLRYEVEMVRLDEAGAVAEMRLSYQVLPRSRVEPALWTGLEWQRGRDYRAVMPCW